jgi:hypothetical protein
LILKHLAEALGTTVCLDDWAAPRATTRRRFALWALHGFRVMCSGFAGWHCAVDGNGQPKSRRQRVALRILDRPILSKNNDSRCDRRLPLVDKKVPESIRREPC